MKKLAVLTVPLVLTACQTMNAANPVEIRTIREQFNIEIKEHPRPLKLYKNVKIYVVTERNYKRFLKRYKKENNTGTFYAFSPQTYKLMSLNINELKRYIKEQKAIILYYERRIREIQKTRK